MNTPHRGPLGRLYEIEGRRLLLDPSGTGGPAVVFLPGASAIALDYLNVHDRRPRFHAKRSRSAGTDLGYPARRTAPERPVAVLRCRT